MSRFSGLLVALVLSGCAHQMTHEAPSSEGVRHEFDQNYKIDQKAKVSVGDSVIKIRDYFLERVAIPSVTPTETVTVSGPVIQPLVFSSASSYPVKGRIVVDGISYQLVSQNENPAGWNAAMVRPDGTIHNRLAGWNPGLSGPVIVAYEMTVNPPTARMVRKVEERISTSKGYQNYEIIYNGVSNNALQFTYREFSPEGIARTAFYQNLSYEASAEFVRFKKFKIWIHSANSEAIEYTVVEDGIQR